MFCGKCGKETTEGNLYCIYCGNKLENNNIENKSDSEPTMGAYQKFIKDNFSNDGTKTYIKDIMSPVKENKTDMPANEEIQLKKDTVNITTETSTNNTKIKEPPTAWLKFISIIWLIAGIIGVIMYPIYILDIGSTSNVLSTFAIILNSVIGFILSILNIVTYDAIDRHKKSGYYLFLILIFSPILSQIVSIACTTFLIDYDYMNFFASLISYLIFDGIWIPCNYIYISKRKESYFNIIDTDIIICQNCNTRNNINRTNCYMCGKELKKKEITLGISTYLTKVKLSAELRSWIDEYSKIYENIMREELITSIANNTTPSDERIIEINKEMYNFFFYKTTQMINESDSPQVQLRWSFLFTQKFIGLAEIDFNNFTIGMAYLCLFYCFTNKEPNSTTINECLELNHLNRFSLNDILHKLDDEFSETLDKEQYIYCVYCGTKSNIKDNYCTNCGRELKK